MLILYFSPPKSLVYNLLVNFTIENHQTINMYIQSLEIISVLLDLSFENCTVQLLPLNQDNFYSLTP